MKIVYLHQYFNTPNMSGGTRSYEFARRLVANGHDVHMITSDPRGSGSPYETVEDGIRVTWIPVTYSNKMATAARIRAFLAFAAKASLIAGKSRADVIFATSTPLTIAIPGILAKWRQRVPMVFEVRDLWPEMPIALGILQDPVSKKVARWLEHLAYSNSDHIIALSPGMKDGVVASGYPPGKVTVIPNAADLDRFNVGPGDGRAYRARFDWLGDRKLVVYAGTLGMLNGVSYLADVAAEMSRIDPEVRFLVIGSGKQEDLVKQYAKSLGILEANFFMMPSIPKSEIPTVLSAANVCTSLFIDVREMWANSANKFFDGLAAGRPVAINYGGWQAELIESQNCGLVLSPRDARDAARLLFELLSDEPRLRLLGDNARNLARTRFSRDDHAATLLRMLSETVGLEEGDTVREPGNAGT